MSEHTVGDQAALREFSGRLLEFLAGTRSTLDETFEDVTVGTAAAGRAAPSTWRVTGVVRGAYRVWPVGAAERRMALAAGLTVRADDADGRGMRATLSTGAGHVRLEADHPQVVLDALPLGPAAAEVVRALAAAELPIEVHGPEGRLGLLDAAGHHLVADRWR